MNARENMVMSAALLMRRDGVEATSFTNVLEHSGAPRGSIYHYFPRGKTQLMEEAARWGGDYIATALADALEQSGPEAALDFSEQFWRIVLTESDFADGCPIVAATVEGNRTPELREAAGEVFKKWSGVVADGLERHGVEPARAQALGSFFFSSIEGAVILSRAQRSFEPLDQAFGLLRELLRDAVPA
jgi:AcrR family transcriptional regulator